MTVCSEGCAGLALYGFHFNKEGKRVLAKASCMYLKVLGQWMGVSQKRRDSRKKDIYVVQRNLTYPGVR